MSLCQWTPDAASLTVLTPEGLPEEVRTALRRLRELGLGDDAFFLRVLAETLRVDPLRLCATVHSGALGELPGIDLQTLRFIGTRMTLAVYDGSRFAGEIVIDLLTNEIDAVKHRPNPKDPDSIDIIEVTTGALPAATLFQLLQHPDATERLARLRRILTAFAQAICTEAGLVSTPVLAKNAVDAVG